MRKIVFGYIAFLFLLVALFFGSRINLLRGEDRYKYVDGDVQYVARTEGKSFYVYDGNNQWKEMFVTGVNIGAAKPGFFPGDFGVTKQDYLRWFKQIQDMNVNTIRVYVAQMPVFYEALAEYNERADHPLYLMHGVYLNENDIAEYQDAWAQDAKIKNGFMQDIRNIIDIIHGKAKIEQVSGAAGGTYTADVSPYVTGWILGIEWEAEFVETTNHNNPQITDYNGKYTEAHNVTPFEVMLAEAADTVIAYETENYREQRPVALSNWVTSDPLDHPGEPNPIAEDAVSVDVETIKPKAGFKAGMFASYHVYPYYPDMFSYEQKYMQDDPINTYKAYLRELNAYHTMPVLISEVGIPAARGIAHENKISGYNQGHMSETEQGEILVSLINDIYTEDMMGALVFSWQDEWFKRTWNTLDLDLDDRRPYWMDYQTNEQNFGILSFDPGTETSVCYVDGDVSEWTEEDLVTQDGDTALYTKSDEKFLYMMVKDDGFGNETLHIPIDTVAGQGNTQADGKALGMGAEFLLVLNGEENSTVLVDAYYDTTYFIYGYKNTIITRDERYERKDSGLFVPVTLMLNRELFIPQTQQVAPYETFDTGKLRYGIANPDKDGYDSLADFYHKDGYTEIRIPWLLLNIGDPSSGKCIADMYANDEITHQDMQPIRMGILRQGGAEVTSSGTYSWQRWDTPTYHERLKKSYTILQAYFAGFNSKVIVVGKTSFERFWAQWNATAFSDVAKWFPIQPVLNYAVAFLLSLIVYFLMVLGIIHVSSAVRNRRVKAMQEKVKAAAYGVTQLVYKKNGKVRIPGVRRPLSRNSLVVMAELMENAQGKERQELREKLLEIGYGPHIEKQIHSRKVEYLILIMRMIGQLELKNMGKEITPLLYKYTQNIDLQYQGFMTLALLGDYEQITKICMDVSFTHSLSFRSLQEILKTYVGDKRQLYKALLASPDVFIQRICIKRIGIEQFVDMAGDIFPFLDAQNYNMVIDAARTLGQLHYKPAADKLVALLEDEHWEVRSIAVTALAQIDLSAHESAIIGMLGDREWQGRYNSADALTRSPNIQRILHDVESTGDRYAHEILLYLVVEANIRGEEA